MSTTMLLEQTEPHDLLDAIEVESVLQSTPSGLDAVIGVGEMEK